jgi:hypothetical protein
MSATHRGGLVFRLRTAWVAGALTGAAACASTPPPQLLVPEPKPVVQPPPPPPPPEAEAPGKLELAVAALDGRNYDAAHARLLEVVDLCGSAPLGQQALLLMAVAELDPRNPDPRRDLAAESTALLWEETYARGWAHTLAESLYMIALRLGAGNAGPTDAEAAELEWRVRAAPAGDSSADSLSTSYCGPVWPTRLTPPTTSAPEDLLPSLNGSSYPAQVAELRRRVRELEEELERIRRIVGQ